MDAAAVLNLHAVQHATFSDNDAYDGAREFCRNNTDSGKARFGSVNVCTANPCLVWVIVVTMQESEACYVMR